MSASPNVSLIHWLMVLVSLDKKGLKPKINCDVERTLLVLLYVLYVDFLHDF